MYIERQLEKKFIAINEEYACVLLTGPRQVGKSTMLKIEYLRFLQGFPEVS